MNSTSSPTDLPTEPTEVLKALAANPIFKNATHIERFNGKFGNGDSFAAFATSKRLSLYMQAMPNGSAKLGDDLKARMKTMEKLRPSFLHPKDRKAFNALMGEFETLMAHAESLGMFDDTKRFLQTTTEAEQQAVKTDHAAAITAERSPSQEGLPARNR